MLSSPHYCNRFISGGPLGRVPPVARVQDPDPPGRDQGAGGDAREDDKDLEEQQGKPAAAGAGGDQGGGRTEKVGQDQRRGRLTKGMFQVLAFPATLYFINKYISHLISK
jgi:hypothetical protein